MQMLLGCAIGVLGWFVLRFIRMGLYTVDQKERAVKTSFRRAARVIGHYYFAGWRCLRYRIGKGPASDRR
jgi:hypothetical protein